MRYSGVRRRTVVAAVMLAAACSDRDIGGTSGGGVAGGFGSGGFGGKGGFAGSAGAFTGTGGSGSIAGFGAVAGAIELPTDPTANGAPLATGALPKEYAPENCPSTYGFGTACVQYFACELGCAVGSPCPNAQSGTPRVRCVVGPFPSPTCVLGCGDGAVCPNGMQCVVTGEATLGSICLWPNYLLREGCPGWCTPLGNICTSAADYCCDGSVCAPWGVCTLGTCLEPGWPCEVGGRQCCSGSCQNGACP